MWFMGDFDGDRENDRKIVFKKVKCVLEAYHCLLSKNTQFRFFQRSGAKICVKHQMSFWGALEARAKSNSWARLENSHKKAFGKLKQSESNI